MRARLVRGLALSWCITLGVYYIIVDLSREVTPDMYCTVMCTEYTWRLFCHCRSMTLRHEITGSELNDVYRIYGLGT